MKRLFIFCLSLLTLASCLPLKQDFIEITTSSPMTVPALGGYEAIGYTINTQIDGAEVEARANEGWITDIFVDYSNVTFTVAANDTNSERRATVTITYAEESTDVTIIQPVIDFDSEDLGNKAIRYTTNDGKIAGPVPSEADASDYYAMYGTRLKANVYTEDGGMIIFEDEVQNIPTGMFEDARNLVSIDIPESVEWISQNAFLACTKLVDVTLHEGLVGMSGFAFQLCTSLRSLNIPESVSQIGGNIILNCSNFEEFQGAYASADGRALIKDNVLYAFAPAGMTSYDIPENIVEIGDNAFNGADDLTTVRIPMSVESIGGNAFSDCRKLKSFVGKFASDGGRALIDGELFIAVASADLESYTVPKGIVEIFEGAFSGCETLVDVSLPEGLEIIDDHAFEGFCGTGIKLPSTLYYIGLQAFAFTELESLTLPESLTSIDRKAFEANRQLKTLYCLSTTPPYLGEEGLARGAEGRKIYVPAESVELYKSEGYGWSDYVHEIVAM